MRGRKPKPLHLRLLDGNAGHRPVPNDVPEVASTLGEPPADLHPRQQIIWREALSQAPEGMLSSLDWSVFAAWVAAVHTFELARANVTAKGIVIRKQDGKHVQNPYLHIQNKQALLIKAYAAELGFSPTARMRVHVKPKNDGNNPFDDLQSLDDE